MQNAPDTLLTAHELGFTLSHGRVLFSGLNFGLGRGRTGLVGANGVGKSTLAQLLAMRLTPTTGHVVQSGRVAYLPQQRIDPGPRDESDETPTVGHALGIAVRLAALLRIERGSTDSSDFDLVGADWDLRERAQAELCRLGLDRLGLDRPLTSLSGGEATRVALAGLALDGPDLAILDEPTNDLDRDSRESLYRWVESWSRGLLVISHDRVLLSHMDRMLELGPRGLSAYGGNYASYVEQRRAADEAAGRDLAHARKELKLTERVAQASRERQEQRSAKGHKDRTSGGVPKVLLGARRERADATSGRLRGVGEERTKAAEERVAEARERGDERSSLDVSLNPSGVHTKQSVLIMKDVCYTHPGAPHGVTRNVTLTLRGPERVAVTGPNGSGKSTLLRLAMGEIAPVSGTVELGVDRTSVAYLDQRAALLGSDASVLESFRTSNPGLSLNEARHALARYLFRGDSALASVDSLSGGERIRAALACTVGASRPPQLLLLDEPTNHLDLDSIQAVEAVIREYDGALLVVSHDPDFLDAVGVDRELAL